MACVERQSQSGFLEPPTRTSTIEPQTNSRRGSKQLSGGRHGSKESTGAVLRQGLNMAAESGSIEPQSSSRRGSKQLTGRRLSSKEITRVTPRQGPNAAAEAAARLLLGKMPSEAEAGASPTGIAAGRQIQQIACRGRSSPDRHPESGHHEASDGDDWESAVHSVAAKMRQLAEMARKLDSELPVQEAQLLKIQQLRLMFEEFGSSALPVHMKERFETHFKTLGCLVGAPPKIFDPEFDRAVTTVIWVFKSSAGTSIALPR